VVKETCDLSSARYMDLPEFYEMIGRVADLKFKHSVAMGLAEKIENVLDEIFVHINVTRNPVIFNEESEKYIKTENEYFKASITILKDNQRFKNNEEETKKELKSIFEDYVYQEE